MKITGGHTFYTCFTCLGDSDNPLVCTICGATIEPFNPNSALFSPPVQGKYFVPFDIASKDKIDSVLNELKKEYFQSLKTQDGIEGLMIFSNEISYQKFIEILCRATGFDLCEIRKLIPFAPSKVQT